MNNVVLCVLFEHKSDIICCLNFLGSSFIQPLEF